METTETTETTEARPPKLTLTLMQGAPGSGKSTRAKEIKAQTGAIICSTDSYFMEPTGTLPSGLPDYGNMTYQFRADKLFEFHKANFDTAITILKHGRSVIVDNTNLKRKDVEKYVIAALRLGAQIKVERVTGTFQNEHGVSDQKVAEMRERMDDLTPLTVRTLGELLAFRAVDYCDGQRDLRFGTLAAALVSLGLTQTKLENVPSPYVEGDVMPPMWLFKHPRTDKITVLPFLKDEEKVRSAHLITVRNDVVLNGVATRDQWIEAIFQADLAAPC